MERERAVINKGRDAIDKEYIKYLNNRRRTVPRRARPIVLKGFASAKARLNGRTGVVLGRSHIRLLVQLDVMPPAGRTAPIWVSPYHVRPATKTKIVRSHEVLLAKPVTVDCSQHNCTPVQLLGVRVLDAEGAFVELPMECHAREFRQCGDTGAGCGVLGECTAKNLLEIAPTCLQKKKVSPGQTRTIPVGGSDEVLYHVRLRLAPRSGVG